MLDMVLHGDGVTENSGSYVTQLPSGTASGLPLTVRETPQSVTAVTNQQMWDKAVTILNQAIVWTRPGGDAGQWRIPGGVKNNGMLTLVPMSRPVQKRVACKTPLVWYAIPHDSPDCSDPRVFR